MTRFGDPNNTNTNNMSSSSSLLVKKVNSFQLSKIQNDKNVSDEKLLRPKQERRGLYVVLLSSSGIKAIVNSFMICLVRPEFEVRTFHVPWRTERKKIDNRGDVWRWRLAAL